MITITKSDSLVSIPGCQQARPILVYLPFGQALVLTQKLSYPTCQTEGDLSFLPAVSHERIRLVWLDGKPDHYSKHRCFSVSVLASSIQKNQYFYSIVKKQRWRSSTSNHSEQQTLIMTVEDEADFTGRMLVLFCWFKGLMDGEIQEASIFRGGNLSAFTDQSV